MYFNTLLKNKHSEFVFLKKKSMYIAADAHAPWVVSVAMVSVAIILTMLCKRIPVFYKEWFQLPAPSQWVIEMIR